MRFFSNHSNGLFLTKTHSFFKKLIAVYFVCLTTLCTAQNVEHWSENEQLASRAVNFGFQDSHGFLWFATDNGLSRFDGYTFVNFRTNNLKGLASNKISTLCEDHEGNIWIGTQEGISVLNAKTYKIIHTYKRSSKSTSIKSNGICWIRKNKKNQIWVTTVDGFLHLYQGKGNFKHVKNPFSKDDRFGNLPNSTFSNNSVYLATVQNGIFEIDQQTFKVKRHTEVKLAPHNGLITTIKGKGVVVSGKEGFFLMDKNNHKLKPAFGYFGAETYFLLKDSEGDYWSIQHDRKQLRHYNIEDYHLTEWTDIVFNPHDNVHMTYLFEDASNNIWICTNKGVYKSSNEKRAFRSILRLDQFNVPNYIPSFRGMLEDQDGTLFIGGYSGLFRMETTGKINRLFDNVIPYTPYLLIPKNNNELWCLCEGYGIISVHKKTGKIKEYPDPFAVSKDYKGIYLKSGILARDGQFWLGSYNGLMRFDPKRERYFKQPISYGKIDLTSNFLATQITQDVNGNLWICSNEGVFVFTEKGNPLYHYYKGAKKPYHIPFNDVKCMIKDRVHNYWFGSASEGIALMTKKGVRSFTTSNQLSDNGIACLLEDAVGRIWVTTNKGISVYHPSNGQFKSYYVEDGLSDNEFNHASVLKTENGRLLFGGINGINLFNPKVLANKLKRKGKLVISHVEIPLSDNKKKVYNNDRSIRKGIHLPPQMGHFYLEFFLDDYVRSEKNTFEYLLEGYDKEWQSLGQQNHIRFMGLAPGNYVLKVRSISSKGISAMNQLSIPIYVDQLFYKTWWFIGLILLGVLIAISYLLFMRFRRLKMVFDLRIAIASDIHDNLGSSLTSIAMESEILEEDATAEQQIMFRKISTSCRLAISSMRDMVWSIDERNGTVKNLFDKWSEHAQKMLGLAEVPYHFNFDFRLNEEKLSALQRQELFTIFKEAILNCIKHSNGETILIDVIKEERTMILLIRNKIKASSQGKSAGSGMKNMRMRVAKINGKLAVQSDEEFELCIIIPLRRKFRIFGRQ